MKLTGKIFESSERLSQDIVYENNAEKFVSIHFAGKTILIFQYEIIIFSLSEVSVRNRQLASMGDELNENCRWYFLMIIFVR